MPQFARPDADTIIENWTDEGGAATDLFQSIDEVTFDDADFVRSPLPAVAGDVYVCRLSDVTDPAVSTGHIIRARLNKSGGGATIDMTVELRQGYVSEASQGTLIATLTQANVTNSFVEYTYTLSAGEADSITDYTDLFLRFTADTV